MPQGSRRLKIKSDEFGVVDYEFPEKLEKQVAYRLGIVPLKQDPFSQEAIDEANKIISRYWQVTGLKNIMDMLPSYDVSSEVCIVNKEDTLIYETRASLDCSSKKCL